MQPRRTAPPYSVVRCDRCAFWRQLGDGFGLCHCHAPKPRDRAEPVAHWPVTDPAQGCGDGIATEEQANARTRCGDCVFWTTNPGGGLTPQNRGDERWSWWSEAGRCLRHAPRPSSFPGNRGFWAATHKDDGCSEGETVPTAK
jgi:hypothetical protein